MPEHKCYWFESYQKQNIIRHDVELPKEVDVLIIGGGIAGLSCLYHLASTTSLKTLLVEDDRIAYRSSGRGNGHISNIRYIKEPNQSYIDAIDLLKNTIVAEEIDCDFIVNGSIHLAATKDQLEFYQNFGTVLDTQEIRSLIPASNFLGGLYLPDDARINPFKFARGLLRRANFMQNQIATNSFVEQVLHDDNYCYVKIKNRGTITAKYVVYCTGAYSGRLLDLPFRFQKNHVISSKLMSHESISHISDSNITYDRGNYSITTNANHMIVSKIGADVASLEDGYYDINEYQSILRFLYTQFPGLKYSPEYVWSYYSFGEEQPYAGLVQGRKNQFMSIGYGHYDIALMFRNGLLIRDHIVGEK